MNITLTPENERMIREELASGRWPSVDDIIAKALEALRERERAMTQQAAEARQQAVGEMLAFGGRHKLTLEGMSIRELIHQGRRY